MTTVNLLPWREQQREERKQEFFAELMAAAMLAVLLLIVVHFYVGHLVSVQTARNNRLQQEIDILDGKIKEISGLQKEKEQLVARMRIIQQLQGDRAQVVRVFDDFVRVLPDGVFLTSIKRDGEKVIFTGMAESNTRVSALMRNIDASESLTQPVLIEIKTHPIAQDAHTNDFILQMQVRSPLEPEADSSKKKLPTSTKTGNKARK